MFKRLAKLSIFLALTALAWLIFGIVSGEEIQPYRLVLLLAVIFFYIIISKRGKDDQEHDLVLPSTRRQRKAHKSWINRIDQD